MISAVIILFASPVFAISVTYQLSVTVPPHTTPAADITEQKEALVNGIPKITTQLVIQQEEITRNDQRVTMRSTVVL
jgi:hypothetical protein